MCRSTWRPALLPMKATVLTQVGQVRRRQPDPARTQVPRGIGGEQQCQGLVVRMDQAGHQDHLAALDVRVQAHQGLSIGEAMPVQRHAVSAQLVGEGFSEGPVVGQVQDDRRHTASDTSKMGGREVTYWSA